MTDNDTYGRSLAAAYESPEELGNILGAYDHYPDDIARWLARLGLLYGVPVNYLVPSEEMLPPESIRFFHVDPRWTAALTDGASSVGRIPGHGEPSKSVLLDRAVKPVITEKSRKALPSIRARFLGLPARTEAPEKMSGFLLRSSVVADCPGLGVDAYPREGVPTDTDPGTPLAILRMERLGPDSDTLICITGGEIYRVDIHEPPEALHYGLDSFECASGKVSCFKKIYGFTVDSSEGYNRITIGTEPITEDLAALGCLRAQGADRVIDMARMAEVIGRDASPDGKADASEMGFEMTEGVGMVTFLNKTAER